ncbi:hypothetical protein [Paraburkholderia sp. JHI869]|uniref:hypothetical protein n=1 Tax=Paraburkholderia sp. JHI869 TaxID=3112959 RepID=UPI00317BF087
MNDSTIQTADGGVSLSAPSDAARSPQGWKLMPIEPTVDAFNAMSIALGLEPLPPSSDDGYSIAGPQSTVRQAYDAALTAAPVAHAAELRVEVAAPGKAYQDEAEAQAQIAPPEGIDTPSEADAPCACTPKPSRQRAARLLATIAAARFDLRKISPCNERTAVSTALDEAERLAREVIDNPVPDSVRAALERMCTPLDQSWLSGATAQADAHCMKVIREYVLGSKAARG